LPVAGSSRGTSAISAAWLGSLGNSMYQTCMRGLACSTRSTSVPGASTGPSLVVW